VKCPSLLHLPGSWDPGARVTTRSEIKFGAQSRGSEARETPVFSTFARVRRPGRYDSGNLRRGAARVGLPPFRGRPNPGTRSGRIGTGRGSPGRRTSGGGKPVWHACRGCRHAFTSDPTPADPAAIGRRPVPDRARTPGDRLRPAENSRFRRATTGRGLSLAMPRKNRVET
jgi:hypothetical protein